MQKFVALVLSLAFYSGQSLAETFIIPSPYRIQRYQHNSPLPLAWAQRKLAGGAYSASEKTLEQAGELDTETESSDVEFYGFYNFEAFGGELAYKTGESDQKNPNIPENEETKAKTLTLKLGSIPQGSPLAFGFGYEKLDEKVDSDALSDYEQKTTGTSLAVGSLLASGLHWGFILEQDKFKVDSQSAEKTEYFYLGAGQVSEDKSGEVVLLYSNEEGDKTMGFRAQGVLNQSDYQYLGDIAYINTDDDEGEDILYYLLKAGVHVTLNEFYVQPKVGYSMIEFKDIAGEAEVKGLTYEIEGGYKTSQFDVYLNVGRGNTETKFVGAQAEEVDLNYRVGAHAYF